MLLDGLNVVQGNRYLPRSLKLVRNIPSNNFHLTLLSKFGDEYRPCKLTRHVVGVHRRNGTNDFVFANVLDAVLYSNLQQFSVGKPILVFCATRKGTE